MNFRALVASMLLLISSPAAAAEYLAIFTGKVSSTSDGGLFQAIDGQSFRLVFKVVHPLPGSNYLSNSTDGTIITGGTFYPSTSAAPVSAVFTLNGISRALTGSYLSYMRKGDDLFDLGDTLRYIAHEEGPSGASVIDASFIGPNLFSSNDLNEPFSADISQAFQSYAAYQFIETRNGQLFSGSGFLNVERVEYVPTGVPEPSTWLMMIIGFGMVGGAMRRRAGWKRAIA